MGLKGEPGLRPVVPGDGRVLESSTLAAPHRTSADDRDAVTWEVAADGWAFAHVDGVSLRVVPFYGARGRRRPKSWHWYAEVKLPHERLLELSDHCDHAGRCDAQREAAKALPLLRVLRAVARGETEAPPRRVRQLRLGVRLAAVQR